MNLRIINTSRRILYADIFFTFRTRIVNEISIDSICIVRYIVCIAIDFTMFLASAHINKNHLSFVAGEYVYGSFHTHSYGKFVLYNRHN